MMSRRHEEDLGIRGRRDRHRVDPYPKRLNIEAGDERDLGYRARRSLSPRTGIEQTERVMGRSGNVHDEARRSMDRRVMMDRREYAHAELHMKYGRGDRIGSRSPPHGVRVLKKRVLDERLLNDVPLLTVPEELRGKYECPEYVDYDGEVKKTRVRRVYDYDNQLGIGKEVVVRKTLQDMGPCGDPLKDSVDMIDGDGRETEHLILDHRYGPNCRKSNKGDSPGDLYSFRDERIKYQDVISKDKLLLEGYYKDEINYACHFQDASYPSSSTTQFKIHDHDYVEKGNSRATSGFKMEEFPGNIEDVHPFSKEGRRRYEELTEVYGDNKYDQKPVLNHRIYETRRMDTVYYHCDVCASTRAIHEGCYHSKSRVHEGDPCYASHDEIYRKIPTYVQEDCEDRRLPREAISDLILDKVIVAEGSHGFPGSSGARDVDAIHKEAPLTTYVDMRRILQTSLQAEEYLDSGYNDEKFAKSGDSREHRLPDSRVPSVNLEYPNDASRTVLRSTRTFSGFMKHEEVERVGGGLGRITSDQHIAYDRPSTSEYRRDEKIPKTDVRYVISGRWYEQDRAHRHDAGQPELITKSRLLSKVPPRLDDKHYFDSEIYHHKGSTKHSGSKYQEKAVTMLRHSGKSHDSDTEKFRRHSKLELSQGSSPSHYTNRRNDVPKHHRARKTFEANHFNDNVEDDILYESSEGPPRREPPEESGEFKNMVHMAFLEYSKRLNENPAARKLYKEEGRAGNLFCVVCKRSNSKEFRDTVSLVKHASMSNKVGLKSQHLGLQKAICVLMGWNMVVPRDAATWNPEILLEAEALAQKEDLILWPPMVIVHNISLSSGNHREWKLIDIEALAAFLAGKGFIRGKMKICLGCPGDQSVMVVKFMGTFSGLHQAERLHQHFADKKHGRMGFKSVMNDIRKGKSKNHSDEICGTSEESLLYGYMGIADDMDELDYDTKKRSSVKSKREIQELDAAPLKPE